MFNQKTPPSPSLKKERADTGLLLFPLFTKEGIKGSSYFIFVLILVCFLSGCATSSSTSVVPPEILLLEPEIRQAVLVKTANRVDSRATVYVWENFNGKWKEIVKAFPSIIGRNGIAPLNEKIEGDGRTPSGTFEIRRAFGYDAQIQTGLDYRQATNKDFWIDEILSPDYNRWISGDTPKESHENLRRDDDLYKYAIIIEYNTDPITPGKGSAIFMHIWRDQDKPTAGCVAMAEKDIVGLLKWLDKTKNPVVILK